MLKRLFDIIFSLMGLLALAPVFVVISLLIKWEDDGPVFYRGVRVGRSGKPFKIFKFRTMVVDADKIGGTSTSEDDLRITKVGRFIRKYKFDEFPQLLNVLIGEMSVVGPRPQVQWAVDLYKPEERILLMVKPGISDYASIKFKNEALILKGSEDTDKVYLEKIAPEKIRLGLEYVKNRSLWVDLQIIFTTIVEIFKKQ
jgi:lipopolysaccharide/colanic/teichoic acid biosynthesis glycosyltransferase